MPKANGARKSLQRVRIVMEHVLAPDAGERLRRAFDLILRVAARAQEAPGTKSGNPKEGGDASTQ